MNRKSSDIYLYERKLVKNADLNVWFVYPGTESFALSSLGYLWLFKSIDELDNINIEMACSDKFPTQIPRDKVDLVAFSMSFDFDFLEVLSLLDKNNYNFKSKQRSESDPLIYAGGPVITSNPEPYCEIFDFMVIGDGEEVTLQLINILINNKNLTKSEKLYELSKLEGIYVPYTGRKMIHKITQKKLTSCIYTPIISENAFFKNTFIVEIERGCTNRCGFCLASYNNLPIRFAPQEDILSVIDIALLHTNKIALLGAQVASHPRFNDICQYIYQKIKDGAQIEMSVSSLRVDAFKPEIVQTLVAAGQKNLTLAIEAGSQRLRNVINKNITEEQIFQAIDIASSCGLKGIKLYGMLGLPTETDTDIEELITLSKKIKTKYKGFNLSYGFSTFVPKANTPFQWLGRTDDKILEKRAKYLKKELHKIGVSIAVSSLRWDYYQAVLSRGDKRISDYMIEVYKLGGNLGAFKKAAKNLNIDTDYYAVKDYNYNLPLPWDFISIVPGKNFLINECKNLLKK